MDLYEDGCKLQCSDTLNDVSQDPVVIKVDENSGLVSQYLGRRLSQSEERRR